MPYLFAYSNLKTLVIVSVSLDFEPIRDPVAELKLSPVQSHSSPVQSGLNGLDRESIY